MNTATPAATLLVGLTRLITGVRAQWIDGTPPAPGIQRVYFANHASHLDTLVIWSSLPPPLRRQTSPVAAMDYWSRHGLRRWLAVSVFQAILIERGTGGARESLRHLIGALDEGRSLILFPEGSRGDGQHIGELRAGLYHIARERPDVELVPVFLENLSRILPKGSNSFNKSCAFLRNYLYFYHVTQTRQHPRGRRFSRRCGANAAALGTRRQTDSR
jgi:1-acyl-sn-glycerol-3-phosphate acyltransferase